MALLTHSGSSSTDLGAQYIKRDDISDLMMASLIPENNFLGLMEIGAETGDTTVHWTEDRLNLNYVTDNTAGGLGAGTTTWTLATAADTGLLDPGTVLVDETAGDLVVGEQIQVTAILSATTATIVRGYGGTTATTHTQSSVWRIVNRPTYENSTLGRDMSRLRLSKYNLINRFEMNVNISQEQLTRARAGYAPGVPSELKFQFEQRLRELLRTMNQALIYSRPIGGAASTSVGDYSTMTGLVAWLDGTWNATAAPQDALGSTLNDTIINNVNKNITRQGGVPDWLVGGTNFVENFSRLYNDRIRIEQSDETRGFKVKFFDTTLQNSVRLLWDNALFDNTTSALANLATNKGIGFMLDSSRLRIRPFAESLFYIISAPTFSDGDAVRALSKWTFEIRNTGTDVGYANQMIKNLAF